MEKKIKKIIWTIPAKKDLQKIYDFISEVSEPIAFKLINRIINKTDLLEQGFAKIGQREPLLKDKNFNYRYLVESNYKIIYFEREDEILNKRVPVDTQNN